MKHGPFGFRFQPWLAVMLAAITRVAIQGAEPPSVRLYVFDNGTLTGINAASFGMKKEELATTDMVATSYLVVHPKGTLQWDAGVVSDGDIKAGRTEFRTPGYLATATKTLESQLASIGLRKQDVTYLALSHYHLDHAANANDFAGSTWLVQKPEYEAMLAEPREHVRARYAALLHSRNQLLAGDLDVFGDGAVVIKAAYGHTPGHQVLQITLPKTGVVVLAGDLYHFQEQRTSSAAPKGFDPVQLAASRAAVEKLIKSTKGQLWLSHDRDNFGRLKKAPACYD